MAGDTAVTMDHIASEDGSQAATEVEEVAIKAASTVDKTSYDTASIRKQLARDAAQNTISDAGKVGSGGQDAAADEVNTSDGKGGPLAVSNQDVSIDPHNALLGAVLTHQPASDARDGDAGAHTADVRGSKAVDVRCRKAEKKEADHVPQAVSRARALPPSSQVTGDQSGALPI